MSKKNKKQMKPNELVKAIREKYPQDNGEPMTQQYLAELGGWTASAVHRWETGKARPHKNNLRDLRAIFEDGPEFFVDRTRYGSKK